MIVVVDLWAWHLSQSLQTTTHFVYTDTWLDIGEAWCQDAWSQA